MEMKKNVLDRVRILEEKKGIRYAKKGGPAYSRLRILYTLIGIYTLIIHLLFLLGLWLQYKDFPDQFSGFTGPIIATVICTAAIIAGYVLPRFQWDLIACLISIIPEGVLIVLFGQMMEVEVKTGFLNHKPPYYWRHLAPLALLILFMVIMTVIALREKRILKKQYKQVLETLYAAYREEKGESFSEENWQEFLNSYEAARHHEFFTKKENEKQKFVSEETEENERKNEKTED